MPTAQSRTAVHLFLFSYLSAACIIFLCACFAFGVTLLTIHQEVQVRTLASAMNAGMIRSQRLLRNSIIFIGPSSDYAQALAEIRADLPTWEGVHTAYTTGANGIHPSDFSEDELARLKAEEPDYQKIRNGLYTLLALEPRKLDKPTLAAISDVFYTEPHYFSALYYVFTDLNTQADTYVNRAQLIDTVMYVGTVVTLILEFLFVIRPANAKLRAALRAISTKEHE